ncbi:MAG: outer rane assembly lipoprotein YfiO [Caulobacter sp.]|nr:outer rane assembly lipoprotein YfiO [Caulobacter sp.]
MLRHKWGRSAVVIAALTCALALSACAGKHKKPVLRYQERPVELLYATGADRLDHHAWSEAVDYFREVERQHPYSEWARRAVLMTAYAHYQANQYSDAIEDADRFLSLYPGNPSAVYAYYLKAICYFEQITDVGRDQGYTEQALAGLRDVVTRYPRSEYAADARLKIDMVNDQLAGKEMAVGRYYLREGQTLAAIGRFRTVVDKYQTTTHTPEALYRLVEAYLTLGLTDEARRNGAVLGFNFPGDPWYSDAYKLLTSKGLRPATPPLEKGAKKSFFQRLIQGKDSTLPPPASEGGPAAAAPAETPALQAPPADANEQKPVEAPKKKKRGFHVWPF